MYFVIVKKNYPKDYCEETVESVNGYPKYRCRNNGAMIKVHIIDVNNHWVVPYNPWLLQKHGAHINVEACMAIKLVKYLYTRAMTALSWQQLHGQELLQHP